MTTDPDAAARARLHDGRTWNDFCDQLRAAGQLILADDAPSDPLTRAEGFRYLSRLTRAALENFVEYADPLAPSLRRVVHETIKMGADNPDNYYYNATISGAHTYRLWGRRGSVQFLGLYTQAGHYGQGMGMPTTGHLDSSELTLGPDGAFEVTVSRERPAQGDWLPLSPDSGTLIVRQTFGDRARETLAEVNLERVGDPHRPAPLEPGQLDRALLSSGSLVYGATLLFSHWARQFQGHVNELPRFDQATSDAAGGDPNIAYYHSYWRLGPDEALVVDATPPPCLFWNFQLGNHWMESLDYRFYRIHLNNVDAVLRDDGSVRVIVAHADPGRPNWLDTAGHAFGTMCWRWVRATENPEPRCRVVPFAQLADLE